MSRKTPLLGPGIAVALAAGAALGDDDPTSRLLLERAQREDAFTLGVQQSMENARAGTLGRGERQAPEARQRDQRRQQDTLFYRQQMQRHAPASDIERRAEAMRAEQAREEQLSRFRFESRSTPAGEPYAPPPVIAPTIETAPIPRAPDRPVELPRAQPDAQALAQIRRVETAAGTLSQAAYAGDWDAVKGVLGEVRSGVDALRADAFKAEYRRGGGRVETLAAVLERLDAGIARTETQLSARDAHAVMRSANALMLAAAELVPDIAHPVARLPRERR
ncbi:MAG: hypothetical protein R3357_15140 [Burkholderiales bacterium]|nr:hypothetical protein [Burkholderiales bacterium]